MFATPLCCALFPQKRYVYSSRVASFDLQNLLETVGAGGGGCRSVSRVGKLRLKKDDAAAAPARKSWRQRPGPAVRSVSSPSLRGPLLPASVPLETASFFPRARLPPEHICFHEPLDGVPPRPPPADASVPRTRRHLSSGRGDGTYVRLAPLAGVRFCPSWFSALKASLCTVIPDGPRVLLLTSGPTGRR